jgi:DNA-binding PadR family transcriptional regulator
MTDILAILQNNDNATPNSRYWGLQRSYILEEIRDFEFKSFPDTGSPQTLNKELSAILSRMQDLGLISQGAEYVSGQRKKFSCTSEGEEWLENQK